MPKPSYHPLFNNMASAFRANRIPALCLPLLALALVGSYFYWPAARPAFDYFSQLKQRNGSQYALLSTALFGGLIPYAYLLLAGKIKQQAWQQALFYCLLWAFMGWLIDHFYLLQAVWFGNDHGLLTIIKKTAFDQFVFSALLTCPFLTLCFLWKDQGFNWQRTRRRLTRRWLLLSIPTTVVTNWLVWIPSVSLIYSLPLPLQLPMFNLVLCFFVLVLSILNSDNTAV